MPKSIIDTLNKILEEKGETFAQVLVDGINIGMVLGAMKQNSEAKCEGA